MGLGAAFAPSFCSRHVIIQPFGVWVGQRSSRLWRQAVEFYNLITDVPAALRRRLELDDLQLFETTLATQEPRIAPNANSARLRKPHGAKSGSFGHWVGIGWEAVSALPVEEPASPVKSWTSNEKNGATGRTRTSDPHIRSLKLQLFWSASASWSP